MAMYLGSNKVEIGTASGGGSSDFTTAQVTVTNNFNGDFSLENCICCVNEGESGEGSPAMVSCIAEPPEFGTTATYTVPLYKGACLWFITTGQTIDTTGDIINTIGPVCIISGDGTITVSGAPGVPEIDIPLS